MILKLIQIYDLSEIRSKLESTTLPIKTSYKFTKLFHTMEVEIDFYLSQLQEIIKQYAEFDEEGKIIYTDATKGYIKVKEDTRNECYKKMSELGEVEVEIPDISFSIEELSNLRITPKDLQKLTPFIKE